MFFRFVSYLWCVYDAQPDMNVYSTLFWVNLCTGLREQWRRSDNLAQASGARLSESIRKPLPGVARTVAQATSSCFEREPISLKRGGLA